MVPPTPEEFIALLKTEPLSKLVDEYVFSAEPYAFQERPQAHLDMKKHLSNSLSVQAEDITVVGSAKMGFSLSPDTRFRPFSSSSDIDIAVISAELFDRIWSIILDWHNPRRTGHLQEYDLEWMLRSRRRIYWGTLRPDELRYSGVSFPEKLKPLRDLTTRWFNAFRELSKLSVFDSREASGFLYRSWWHASLYHTYGLIQIRSQIPRPG